MPDTTLPWTARSAAASPLPHPHQLVARTVYFHPTEPVLFVDYDVPAVPPPPGTGKPNTAANAPHHRRRRRRIPIRAWRRAKSARSIAEAAAQLMDRHGDVFRSIGEPAVRDMLARLDRINKTAAIARALGVATAAAQAIPLSASSSMSLRGGALELHSGVGETAGKCAELGEGPPPRVASPPVVAPLMPLPARVAPLSTVPAALSIVPAAAVHDGITTPAVKTMRQIQLVGSDVDLNKLDEEQVALIKAQMNAEFEQIRIKPGDAQFKYDKRVEFSKDADASNDWDDSIDQLSASKLSSPVHGTLPKSDESVADEDIVEECLPETSAIDKSLSSASKSSGSRRAWGHLVTDASVSAPVGSVPAEPRVPQDDPVEVEKNDVAALVSSALSPFAPAPLATQPTESVASWRAPRKDLDAAAVPIRSPSLSSIDIDDLLDDGDDEELSPVGRPNGTGIARESPTPALNSARAVPAEPVPAPAPAAQDALSVPVDPAPVPALAPAPAPALGLSALGLPPLAPVASLAGGALRPIKLPGLDPLAGPVRSDTIGKDESDLPAENAPSLATTLFTSPTPPAASSSGAEVGATAAPITASAATLAAPLSTLESATSVIPTTGPCIAAIVDRDLDKSGLDKSVLDKSGLDKSGLDKSLVSESIDEDLSEQESPDTSIAKFSHRSASPDASMAKLDLSAILPEAPRAKSDRSPDVFMAKSDLSAISPDASMAKPQAAHSPPRSTSPAPSDMYSDDFGAGETVSEADTTRTSSHATDDVSDASFSAGHTASTRSDAPESDDEEEEGEKSTTAPAIASTLTALAPAATSLTQVPGVPLTARALAGVSLSDDEDEDIPLEIEGYESDAASDF
ncbi:hypothetical protein AMAG_11905 [Allomyces macrogynus ATCC 38327]|uniref:Centrosomal protein of 19 kDa n=1 Tax=Allomyces macrogynus (strain ATCC 38327) TaxID=578462 RepID=A0A0L0SYM3_ALLM3|nr:hypothetical protein AMAG_11905 [Allomyces macrogynus ATCC 38327]|eukprot:KNE67444.1 hypothetical protein AMAG_11905 [Allomyces macrogynus ATCC 38327]